MHQEGGKRKYIIVKKHRITIFFDSVILLSPTPTRHCPLPPPPLLTAKVKVSRCRSCQLGQHVRTSGERSSALLCAVHKPVLRRAGLRSLTSADPDPQTQDGGLCPLPSLYLCSRMTPYLNTRCGTLITTPATTSVIKWGLDYYLHPDPKPKFRPLSILSMAPGKRSI